MPLRQEIRLLGVFRASVDNIPITDLSAPRVQSLLAYLILHADTPQPRQHLAYVLWPDSTERQARTNLRKIIHQIRASLPAADDCLWTTRSTIQWSPYAPYAVDVLELNRLLAHLDDNAQENVRESAEDTEFIERIAELYAGDLLPNCYDDWIAPFRADYRLRVHAAIGSLVRQLENRRAYDQAIHYARQLSELDPLDETACQQLMRLHLLNRDRPAALAVYQQFASLLQNELGVEPNPETRTVYERILASETPDSSTRPEITLRTGADQLVGRRQEWLTLRAAWQRAAQGNAHLIVLAGEAGIGKTRLAEELLDWARQQGIRTGRTRSYAAHGALAYAPIAELLRTEALGAHLSSIDPIWLTEVARLLPELLTEYPDLPAPQPMAESWQRQRFFDALARAALADDAPLLLLFDDLQWSDQETLEWLNYLLHHSPQAKLLILGTVRADEVDEGHAYAELAMSLTHSNQITSIPLAPLDQEDTQVLATATAGHELTPDQAAQLYRDTEGNPLFVVETIRAQNVDDAGDDLPAHAVPEPNETIHRLPAKVHTVIRGRLARLSPRAHELANLAAVVGRSFSYNVLHRASEQDELTLADGLDELLHRRIVLERGTDAYDFSHDRIRDVAYAEISRVRRRLLHNSVAQALLEISAANLDSISGELAEHFVQAGRSQEAIDFLIRAGDRSADQFANREALDYFARALELLPEGESEQRYSLLQRRVEIYERLQDVNQLPRELDEMERVIEQLDDGSEQAYQRRSVLGFHRVRHVYQLGSPIEAIQIGRQAMQWAEAAHDTDADLRARWIVSLAHWSMGEMQEVRDLLKEPLAVCRREPPMGSLMDR